MSEQQIRREPVDQSNLGGEDPLAELARIVADDGMAQVAAKEAEIATSSVQEVQAPVLVAETQTPAAQTPVAATIAATPPPVLDLESQLLAELGGFQSPMSQAPATTVIAPALEIAVGQLNGEVVAEHHIPLNVPEFETELLATITMAPDSMAPDSRAPGGELVDVEAGMEALFDQELMEDAVQAGDTAIDPVLAPIVNEQVAPEHSGTIPTAPAHADNIALVEPTQNMPSSDELDFEAAFGSVPIPMGQTGGETVGDIIGEDLVQALETPAASKTDQTSNYHFQVAPDFQLQEQKIDESVGQLRNEASKELNIDESVDKLQNETVEELDIDEAFSGVFASELQEEMAGKSNAAVDLGEGFSAVESAAAVPAHSQDIPDEFDFENAFAEENIASHASQFHEEPLPEIIGKAKIEDTPQGRSEPENVPNVELDAILQPKRRIGSATMGVLALGLVAIVGGGVLGYQYVNNNNTPENVMLVRADPSDFKVKPEEPGGKKIANQDQPVYDAVAGDKPAIDTQKALITANEEPVEIARNVVSERSAKSNVRLVNESVVEKKNPTIALMQPRKVKTVTVRADGSIVPVENSAVVETAAVKNITPNAANDNTSIEGATTTGTIAIPSVNPNANTSEIALVKPAGELIDKSNTRSITVPKTVSPIGKPVALAVRKPAVSKPITIRPIAVKTVAPIAPVAPRGPYVVQISSQRSWESAEATYQNLKRRFSGLLDNLPKEIREVNLEGNGTYYRVRILKGTKIAASDFCSRYKKAGGSCFVTK